MRGYGLSGYVVVKEIYGHSSKEVKIIDLDSFDGLSYYEALSKERVRIETINLWWLKNTCIVEEYLGAESEVIPYDFKVYCVDGQANFMDVVDRNHTNPQLTFLDCRTLTIVPWDTIYPDKPLKMWDEGSCLESEVIVRASKAIQEAERICKKVLDVEGILVGIDTYSLSDGEAYLGEITPRMGAMHGLWLKKNFIKSLLLAKE
jgi:hypothetical protein